MTISYLSLTFWVTFKRWKKNKKNESRISKHITYWVVNGLLTLILYVLLLFIYFLIMVLTAYDSTEKRFDAAIWKKEPKIRVLMIEDLKSQKILENKSKAEVLNMLGNPESNDSTYDNFINNLYRSESLNHKTDIIYKLGARKGVLQPIRHLEIWFKNDTVLRYEIR